jgi:hypothetical protein
VPRNEVEFDTSHQLSFPDAQEFDGAELYAGQYPPQNQVLTSIKAESHTYFARRRTTGVTRRRPSDFPSQFRPDPPLGCTPWFGDFEPRYSLTT